MVIFAATFLVVPLSASAPVLYFQDGHANWYRADRFLLFKDPVAPVTSVDLRRPGLGAVCNASASSEEISVVTKERETLAEAGMTEAEIFS